MSCLSGGQVHQTVRLSQAGKAALVDSDAALHTERPLHLQAVLSCPLLLALLIALLHALMLLLFPTQEGSRWRSW
jgi:hypothetical protein